MTQVGGAYVRIRPYVSEDDRRALAALSDLAHDLAAAFDRFHDAIGADLPRGVGPATDDPRQAPDGRHGQEAVPSALFPGEPPTWVT